MVTWYNFRTWSSVTNGSRVLWLRTRPHDQRVTAPSREYWRSRNTTKSRGSWWMEVSRFLQQTEHTLSCRCDGILNRHGLLGAFKIIKVVDASYLNENVIRLEILYRASFKWHAVGRSSWTYFRAFDQTTTHDLLKEMSEVLRMSSRFHTRTRVICSFPRVFGRR